jgi:hypothetical protein
MSENTEACPKCGEVLRFNYVSFFLFACDTKVYRDGSDKINQGAHCALKEELTAALNQLEKAKKALRPFAEAVIISDPNKIVSVRNISSSDFRLAASTLKELEK